MAVEGGSQKDLTREERESQGTPALSLGLETSRLKAEFSFVSFYQDHFDVKEDTYINS